jgi:hypothetical protein
VSSGARRMSRPSAAGRPDPPGEGAPSSDGGRELVSPRPVPLNRGHLKIRILASRYVSRDDRRAVRSIKALAIMSGWGPCNRRWGPASSSSTTPTGSIAPTCAHASTTRLRTKPGWLPARRWSTPATARRGTWPATADRAEHGTEVMAPVGSSTATTQPRVLDRIQRWRHIGTLI